MAVRSDHERIGDSEGAYRWQARRDSRIALIDKGGLLLELIRSRLGLTLPQRLLAQADEVIA
jgi:hypothetical protein